MLLNERSLYAATRRDAPAGQLDTTVEALTGIWLAAVWGERI